MNRTKELAKRLAWASDNMNDNEKHYRRSEWENAEAKAEYEKVVMEIVNSGYDVNMILALMEEYKTLTVAEYREWMERA